MGDVVKVSWSGGKDSTCATIKRIERGDTVKAVCYVPMLTKEIPLIGKEHNEFIHNAAERFRKLGASVDNISGMTYYDFVLHINTKGKRKGKIYGFPCFIAGMCNFRDYSKVKALTRHDVGYYDYQDIGIAFDEKSRQAQLTDKKRSILVEEKITEADARRICEEQGLLSPHYSRNKRDGCALCPNAKLTERIRYFNDFPEARAIVTELQDRVKLEYPEDEPRRYPLRCKKWFVGEGSEEEDEKNRPKQLSLFDLLD